MRTGVSWLDVKFGVRMLVRYPGLSVAGAFAIAVVVACGTAAAAFDAVVNGSLPFEDGDRIVAIENWDARTKQPQPRALHDTAAWRGRRTVEEVGAYRLLKRNLAAADRPAEPVRIAEISASAFRVARVPPLSGRFLLDADEHDAAPPVLLIGYDEWQRRFLRRSERLSAATASNDAKACKQPILSSHASTRAVDTQAVEGATKPPSGRCVRL